MDVETLAAEVASLRQELRGEVAAMMQRVRNLGFRLDRSGQADAGDAPERPNRHEVMTRALRNVIAERDELRSRISGLVQERDEARIENESLKRQLAEAHGVAESLRHDLSGTCGVLQSERDKNAELRAGYGFGA